MPCSSQIQESLISNKAQCEPVPEVFKAFEDSLNYCDAKPAVREAPCR